jgi:predicted homoserine dehydrogenase-like protein
VIIVDRALEARAEAGDPVRVAMVGAGFMGRGIANQILNSVPGMQLVAIANRHVEGAERAFREAGADEIATVDAPADIDRAAQRGVPAVTDDASVLCHADAVEAIIEVTGTVEYAAHVSLEAMEHGKHVVLMNAELDGTVGPILKTYADRAGVIYTGCDGDQPGVQLNLFRFVRSIGARPLVCGNIKGLHDPYRNPTTQEAFAKRWGQMPHMVTSFADGSKISFEQAIVGNATGMGVARRGMLGYEVSGHIDEQTGCYDVDELERLGGIVDYVVGAQPGPGVYVFAAHDDPKQRHYLNLYKLGEGPLYSFYAPYHLCHFEVPLSAARVVLLGDAVITPLGAPVVDVVTTAKTDLSAGTVLDGIGHYMTYGVCENADVAVRDRLLPLGLAEGCTLRQDVSKDAVLTYDDVDVPAGRLADRLRDEQVARFFSPGRGSSGFSSPPLSRR